MKKTLVIALSMIMLLQTFSQLCIMLSYKVNKQYISDNLCENREIPTLDCEGKCYLKKKLDEDSERNHSGSRPQKEQNEVLFLSMTTNEQFLAHFSVEKTHYTYLDDYTTRPGSELLLPPKI